MSSMALPLCHVRRVFPSFCCAQSPCSEPKQDFHGASLGDDPANERLEPGSACWFHDYWGGVSSVDMSIAASSDVVGFASLSQTGVQKFGLPNAFCGYSMLDVAAVQLVVSQPVQNGGASQTCGGIVSYFTIATSRVGGDSRSSVGCSTKMTTSSDDGVRQRIDVTSRQ